jgi:hypothetical protein
MPQALLLPRQTLWEKVRGVQPSYESKGVTVWTLVDKRSRARVAPSAPLDQAKVSLSATTAVAIDAGAVAPPVLGTTAATGTPCPASGWWFCEEINASDGTRWFAQDSLLPAATFVLPYEYGRALGASKAIRRRGTWRLVRLAQAPDTDSGSADDAPSRDDT